MRFVAARPDSRRRPRTRRCERPRQALPSAFAVNLRRRFGLTEGRPAHPAVLLLSGVGQDPLVGLVVDQVLRVLSLPSEGVLSPPPRVFGIRAEYIRGVANAGGRPIVWLDILKVLTATEAITLLT